MFAALSSLLGGAALAEGRKIDLEIPQLRAPDGEIVSLSNLVSGTTVFHLWATWCAPCRDELPEIENYVENANSDVRVILISGDTSDYRYIEEFLDDIGVSLKSYQQLDGTFSREINVLGYPSTVAIDDEGILRFEHMGVIDWGKF